MIFKRPHSWDLFLYNSSPEKDKPTTYIHFLDLQASQFPLTPDLKMILRFLDDSEIRWLPTKSLQLKSFGSTTTTHHDNRGTRVTITMGDCGLPCGTFWHYHPWRPLVFTINQVKSTQLDCERKAPFGVWVFFHRLRQSILFSTTVKKRRLSAPYFENVGNKLN